MVAFIRGEDSSLTLEDERLEMAILDADAKLLVLDPFRAFLPQDTDMQSAQFRNGDRSCLTN